MPSTPNNRDEVKPVVRAQGFAAALLKHIADNVYNLHGPENWESESRGRYRRSLGSALTIRANTILERLGLRLVPWRTEDIDAFMREYGSGLSRFYDLLDDESSKDLLTRIMAFRLLGPRKVKLPLAMEDYWAKKQEVKSLIVRGEQLEADSSGPLSLFDLSPIGYPIRVFGTPVGITALFVWKQYSYELSNPAIRVEEGDYVIDGGGGWGDTALRFAHQAGASGRVYAFELLNENLAVMRKNLALNPPLASRIQVTDRPLWSESGAKLAYSPAGPATRVGGAASGHSGADVTSVSIDAFVQENEIPRVDFIKLDVEGAELMALKGARTTIRTHKPKLAVCLYHRLDDFVNIPDYLSSLDTPYRFFLGHFTISSGETVLFGTPKTPGPSGTGL